MPGHQYRHIRELPETFAAFPLMGALLFPRWELPLNIFEPRYLNMVDDAMAGNRLIGIVQAMGGARACPTLAEVGCIGRITSYAETDDGRYQIALSGIARFRVARELDVTTPYRQIVGDFSNYEADLRDTTEDDLTSIKPALERALKSYVRRRGMTTDWAAVDDAPMETLIHALAAGCPFTPIEKQALLEADDLQIRCQTLIALLEMDIPSDDEDGRLQ